MSGFPVPGTHPSVVAVPAPGQGPGNWVGAPSAALRDDGGFVVAYRLRTADQRGAAVVVAVSDDGEELHEVARLDKDRFGAESLERPALVRAESGGWRLYVSCATPGSKHWRVDLLEAGEPAGLGTAEARTVLPGDEHTGVKDPVVRRGPDGWQAWVCCHPLDEADEEDRMSTRLAVSDDGVAWRWQETVLAGQPGTWDARGARVTAVLADGTAAYDGRASKEENFSERTGLAVPDGNGRLRAQGGGPVADVRYLDVVPLADGGYRLYYETPLADGSHELRTEVVPAAG